MKIRKLLDRKARFISHFYFYSDCITQRIVPKGLTLSLIPTFKFHSPLSSIKWDNSLKNASLQLIKILKLESSYVIKDIDNQLKQLACKMSHNELLTLSAFASNKLKEVHYVKSNKSCRDNITLTPVDGIDICSVLRDVAPCSSGTTNTVFNLSNASLNEAELHVLSKGLSFVPTASTINEFELLNDLHNLGRKMHLQAFFHGKPSTDKTPFKNPSSWTPDSSKTSSSIDNYIKAVYNDIKATVSKPNSTSPGNLLKHEKEALRSLKSRTDIIIRPADKGGGIVVLNTSDYISEANRQLYDPMFYKALDKDPTPSFSILINKKISELVKANLIPHQISKFLRPKNVKPGSFYLLIKVHKENNPGRPIISGIDTPTEKLSLVIDHCIKHIPPRLPSYIKDTNDFLVKINSINEKFGDINNVLLATMDVVSLYTNIPHEEGLLTVESFLNTYPSDTLHSSAIIPLLELVLNCNNFVFNDTHFVQIHGAAMGSRVSPNYANLFMGDFEKRAIESFPVKPLLFLRFIDDIFVLWSGSEASLQQFFVHFNSMHDQIKFSCNYSSTSVNFLDVTVSLKSGRLVTELFKKPTDKRQYLHFDSYHPNIQKKNIPYGQFLRLKRICSDNNDFTKHAKEMSSDFQKRNYPLELVHEAFVKSSRVNTTDLHNTKPKRDNSNLIFSTIYHKSLSIAKSSLKRHLNILHGDEKLKEIFHSNFIHTHAEKQ